MRKKILILAGTHFQIPVIEYAKSHGHYVITCDNKPENPGHKAADEYVNMSTTNLDGVLEVAKTRKIDGILAYASDPAALAASYVSEALHLPGNSYNSVLTLSDKGFFRKFLTENDFPVPVYKVFKSYNEASFFYNTLKRSVFVKPVDSSGSKGITRLPPGADLKSPFNYALEFSRKREVIIEEEIERKGPHIHGEAFIYVGKIIFMLLGDQYFCKANACTPISTTLPSLFHSDLMSEIELKLTRLIKLVDFKTGGLNIEIIRDQNDKIYFLEIGARNGGNFMPELARMATGFNMAGVNVNAVLNEPLDFSYSFPEDMFYTQLILHSHSNGIYSGFNLDKQFIDNIKYKIEYFLKGDNVQIYRDSRFVIGVFLFKFNDKVKCNRFINYIIQNNLINLI